MKGDREIVPRSSYSMSVDHVLTNLIVEKYNVIAHSDKQIEEQSSTFFHLHLHGATPLESVLASDDESQVVSSQL